LLALGEKRSEEPYSPADRRLLQALGGQAAITVENLLLRDRVTREAGIRRDVLERLEGDRLPLLRECPRCGTCSDADGECETDGVELVLTLPIERVLDQRYRLDRRIGQGGMASVFQAWDLRLSRRVAAKILMGRYFGDPVVLRRFAREARSVAALSHPNVVSVYDSGTCGPDGAYLILELVEGQTMRELIRSAAPLSPASAADLLEPLLCGLEAAHRAGLVHRDIKPSNVFIGGTAADPIVKLGDFGIAKRHFEDEEPGTVLTETGALVGTVRYMAPEQLAGLEVDQRADLWAIGLITVELLTGRHPFSGREPAQILAAICGPPIRLEAQGSSARDLETILQRCLTRRPEDRLATAAALRGVLVPALRACGGPVTMVEVPVGSKRTDEPSTLSG
jgi:serine/threonine-protein kinase